MRHPNKQIEAVIFDLGRVLVAIDNTLLVERIFKGLNTSCLQELGRRTMSDPAMVEFNSGRMSPEDFYHAMCRTYDLDLEFGQFTSLWCAIFYAMDGMEALVAQIRPHIRIGLLSDTDPLHWNHIKTTWPWIGAIQNPTLSYETGVMKPAPAIYLRAAENVQTPPEHCLYIDDLEANVQGARAVGMAAERFENTESLKRLFQTLELI